jgi:soluble lytic murein transglycosylase-like protein
MKIIVYISLLMILSTTAFAANREQEKNRKLVRYYAGVMEVDADFCDAIAQIESAYKTNAFNNPKKPLNKETWISRGVMQLTFETGQKFNKKIQEKTDLFHAEKNIIAGIRFIKYLFKKYPEASHEEIAQIYNLGETKYLQGIRNQSYVNKFKYVFYNLKNQYASN